MTATHTLIFLFFLVIVILIICAFVFGMKFLRLKEKELERQNFISSVDHNKELSSEIKESYSDKNRPPLTGGSEVLKENSLTHPKKSVPDINKILRKSFKGLSHLCIDHPEEYSMGLCAISSAPFCEKCLVIHNDIRFGRKYIDIYLESVWVEIAILNNQKASYDSLDRIAKIKRSLWSEKKLPLIIQGNHKINIDLDAVEIYTTILARSEDEGYIKNIFSFLN